MKLLARLSIIATTMCGCGLWNPAGSLDYEPSRLPVGELAIGVWLPAGLGEFRLGAEDRAHLRELGVDRIEWLQRATVDSTTAEEVAMAFCEEAGMRMPVYYEPPGFSPHDKLHDWARGKVTADFDGQVRARIQGLRERWGGATGFWGYLIGHEDYRRQFYPALERTVELLRQEDGGHPAISVGRFDHYQAVERFADAFFVEGGVPNIFQHEQYVFRAEVPGEGKGLRRALDRLVEGYEKVARKLQGRYGRWHAVIQAQSEVRDGRPFYRKPTPAELSLQAGLALSRGASGIVYFLYSSGPEKVRGKEGEVVERRYYEGLVDESGAPTGSYFAAQRLNRRLGQLEPALAELHFHGGVSGRDLLDNELLERAEEDLEFGLFGDGTRATHLLVVNRRTDGKRGARLRVKGETVVDAVTGEALEKVDLDFAVELEAGGFRLLKVD